MLEFLENGLHRFRIIRMNAIMHHAMRAEVLMRRYVRHARGRDMTIWGPHRCFDGLFLPLFATGDREGGNRLLEETLDMIERNLDDERSGRGDKWHLGDFAIHAVWRAYRSFGEQITGPLRERIARQVITYPFHSGGMSENHNLLQYAMAYLAGHAFPEATFHDRKPGRHHREQARQRIIAWTEMYLEHGSEEWGADLYENVNLLSLCNLFDYSPDREVRDASRRVLDLMSREIALNAHAGATSGAARRGYACYRVCARLSPSRPLHWLWFASAEEDMDVPWFCGGVLVAALSGYQPPPETVALAQTAGPLLSTDWNTRAFWQDYVEIAESFRVTTRLPGVQLSGTIIPASASRYTDFTWVASFDEDAVVMANHPHLQPPAHSGAGSDAPWRDILRSYEDGTSTAAPSAHPFWVVGNMPPGTVGDLRPGFWQGHGSAPACWMRGNILLNLFDIHATEPIQWFHLFLPMRSFDEVTQEGHWLFARRGAGWLRIWASHPLEPVTMGTWAHVEWRCPTPRGALFVEIASADVEPLDWEQWKRAAQARDPRFTSDPPAVSVIDNNERILLDRYARFDDALLPPRKRSHVLKNHDTGSGRPVDSRNVQLADQQTVIGTIGKEA